MAVLVALLRAINVGGASTLSMKELAALCTSLGLDDVRTYIQSGNVLFKSTLSKQKVQTSLEQAFAEQMGKRIDVLIRTAVELRQILDANPFPNATPSKVAVAFHSRPVPQTLLDEVVTPGGEEVVLGKREVYIHYPDGMGRAKLRLPATDDVATVRNINTVAKLVALAEGMTG